MKFQGLHRPLAQPNGHCLRRETIVDEIYVIVYRIPNFVNVKCLDSVAYYYCFDLILKERSI